MRISELLLNLLIPWMPLMVVTGGVGTAAGTKLYGCATLPETNDQAGYESTDIIWTEVGEIVDGGGPRGRTYKEVMHMPLGSRGVKKFKGSFDEGNLTLKLGRDVTDAGQVLLNVAKTSDANYSFRVAFPNGAKRYLQAKVMSFLEDVTTVDTVIGATCVLSIQADSAGVGIVEVNS